MKNRLLLVLAFAVLSCSSSAPNVPAYSAAIQEGEDAAYEVVRAGGTSVGISLVTSDRVVFAGGYGMADVQNSVPVTQDTMFPIGSVSKMFAAVAVMQLVDLGLVDLDVPLVQYVPSFTMADPRYAQITVKMLLNHTSGIAGTRYTAAETSVAVPGYAQAVLASLADQRLKADPGAFAVYCNDGWTLTDPLVAAVTGMSYEAWVEQNIFAPLGMKNSTFSLAPLPGGSYAKAYRSGVAQPQEYINVDAAGGIYSTPSDMAAFVRMFLNQGVSAGGTQVLSKASIQKMSEDQTTGTFNPVPYKGFAYGLGWDSVTDPGLGQVGVSGWTKNGGTYYYGAQILVAPNEGLAAVALGPAGGGYSPLAIVQRVLLRALAETGRVPSFPQPLSPQTQPVASAPSGLLASVEGIYANYDYVYQLRAESDGSLTQLTLQSGGFAPSITGLIYRADGWFTSDSSPLVSMSVVSGGANQYLAVRSAGADKAYLDSLAYAQKLASTGGALSSAWTARLAKRWLVVNEPSSSLAFLANQDPRFGLMTLPGLTGVILALPALPPMGLSWQAQAVNASASDQTASMMLLIPGLQGTDLNDLDIVANGSEEWLRWGGYMHRPMETVPVLSAGTTPVAIGPEGFAEWRSVERTETQVSISISGAGAWRLYDSNFQVLGSGEASGQTVLTPVTTPELAYILLFGASASSITVTVQ